MENTSNFVKKKEKKQVMREMLVKPFMYVDDAFFITENENEKYIKFS